MTAATCLLLAAIIAQVPSLPVVAQQQLAVPPQPTFTRSMDTHTVKENTPIGEIVYTLEAQVNATSTRQSVRMFYSIEGTTLFSVDRNTGQVRVAQLIDRELTSDQVMFYVGAQAAYNVNPPGGPQPQRLEYGPPTRIEVTVYIIDENDNPPRIERVRAGRADYDAGALSRSWLAASFLPQTPLLSFGGQRSPVVRVNVSENTQPGSVIVDLIEAIDVDKTSSRPLRALCDCEPDFELVTSDEAGKTLNDRINSSIVLRQQLTHMPHNNIRQLQVNITDGKFNTSIVFEIVIEDVQNKPPFFAGSTTCIVNENVQLDTTILTLMAVDGDVATLDDLSATLNSRQHNVPATLNSGRPIVYELLRPTFSGPTIDGQASMQAEQLQQSAYENFKLHPLTGQLQVANRLDREKYLASNGVLTLNVRARELATPQADLPLVRSDESHESILERLAPHVDQSEEAMSEAVVTVILVDVNDNEPRWLNASEIAALNVDKSAGWFQSLPVDRETGRIYKLQVKENSVAGTPITSRNEMFVYDLDTGDNAVFNLTLVDEFRLFDVEPKRVSGFALVTLKLVDSSAAPHNASQQRRLLDYENFNERRFIIELVATETQTGERLSSRAKIQIDVVDVNDNAPEFKELAYQANVREDAPAGKSVLSVQATDRDRVSAQLTYTLHGQSAYLFDMNRASGLITVAKCVQGAAAYPSRAMRGSSHLNAATHAGDHGDASHKPCIDYERQRSHHLMVEVSDGELSSKVPLTIYVDDASDNAPVFTLPVLDVVIEEGDERIEPPIRVEAIDADASSVVSYSIVEGNFEGLFSINNLTGEIQLTRPIRISHDDAAASASAREIAFASNVAGGQVGYEDLVMRQQQHQFNKMTLIVQATDGQYTANATIRIDVLDSNDNAPKFLRAQYLADLHEASASPGQHVITVRAIDADRGNNARVSYRIERGSYNQFEIDDTSGVISVSRQAHEFDAAKRDNYTLEVVAYDHGMVPKSDFVRVYIHVLAAHLRPPEFEPQVQRATVNEATPNNTIIHQLQVGTAHLHSGQSQALHHHHGGRSSGGSSAGSMSGHSTAGENVALVFEPGPIEALDKNGQPVMADQERLESMFSVSTNTGDVMVGSSLDHEFAARINLTVYVSSRSVLASSNSSASASASIPTSSNQLRRSVGYLLITVIDDNSHAPMFAAPWTPQQPELAFQMLEELPAGSVLTQLAASDVDSKISHYKIEPPNDYFELTSPQSGVIVNRKPIDYDALMKQMYLKPGKQSAANASAAMQPGLTQQGSAAPTLLAGHNIIQFNVFVFDSGLPQLSARATVSVEILPLNDWDCRFEQQVYEARIKENSIADTLVAQVRANDADYGEQHSALRYQLLGDQSDLFNIDSRTGLITVSQKGAANLDRERLKQTTLALTAIGRDEQTPLSGGGASFNSRNTKLKNADQSSTARSCSATVKISVDDVNDNPPLFSQKTYEVTAYDTDVVEVPLVKLIVRDDDVATPPPPPSGGAQSHNWLKAQSRTAVTSTPAPNAASSSNSFSILTGNLNDSFNITNTGLVYATKPLNETFTVGQTIQLRVLVRQSAPALMTSFTDECLVRIHYQKINRYGPEWRFGSLDDSWSPSASSQQSSVSKTNVFNVHENAPPGTLVTRLRCVDRDHLDQRGQQLRDIRPGSSFRSGYFEDAMKNVDEPDTELLQSGQSDSLDASQKLAQLQQRPRNSGAVTDTSAANRQDKTSAIRYWIKLNGSNALETDEFKLDPVSGALSTRIELDRERQEFYQLVVSCEDNGRPQSLESVTPIYVSVMDLNDNKPEFVVASRHHQTSDNDLDASASSTSHRGAARRWPAIRFTVEEHQIKGLTVGELRAIDRDSSNSYPINYCIIEGNDFADFFLDRVTGILYTNQSLDREKQSSYDLLVKAVNDGQSCEYHIQAHANATSGPGAVSMPGATGSLLRAKRGLFSFGSSSASSTSTEASTYSKAATIASETRKPQHDTVSDASSYVWVKVDVLDINDNAPYFKRPLHRAGVHYRSLMNTLVTQVPALDPDSGLNGTLNYRISEILLYKTSSPSSSSGQQSGGRHDGATVDQSATPLPSKPIKLIQYPFRIDQDGNLYTQQLLTQYQLMSMFLLQIEASEMAEPRRIARTRLEVYVFETSNQLKIRINMHPRLVDAYRHELETMLSNATKYTAIINRARTYSAMDARAQQKASSRQAAATAAGTDSSGAYRSSSTLNSLAKSAIAGVDTTGLDTGLQPTYTNIHLIFIDNFRIVNPNLVMEKFDLTSAQIFMPQTLASTSGSSMSEPKNANNNNNDNDNAGSPSRQHPNELASLIDKIALASAQSSEYNASPSSLAGIDWLESPSVVYIIATLSLMAVGFVIFIFGCCCTSRIKNHIIAEAMNKLVKQQEMQAKINEQMLSAANGQSPAAAANGNGTLNGGSSLNGRSNGSNLGAGIASTFNQDYILQQGGYVSAFDATKGCVNNNNDNMNILQRAIDAGEPYIDPNYANLNGHINLCAHYYDDTEIQQQQVNMNGNLEPAEGVEQFNDSGSQMAVQYANESGDQHHAGLEQNGNGYTNGPNAVMKTNGKPLNGISHNQAGLGRQRQQVPNKQENNNNNNNNIMN